MGVRQRQEHPAHTQRAGPLGGAAGEPHVGSAVGRTDDFDLTPPDATCRVASGGVRSKSSVRPTRSEEHTSELQSLAYLVCRLLLEKKKKIWNRESVA